MAFICEKCGADLTPDNPKCINCGYVFGDPGNTDQTIFCVKCGANAVTSDRFCRICGTTLVLPPQRQNVTKLRVKARPKSTQTALSPSEQRQVVPASQFSITSSLPSSCPACGSDSIERVAGIVKKGTVRGTLTGGGGGIGLGFGGAMIGAGAVGGSSISRSDLAKALAEPAPGCLMMSATSSLIFGLLCSIFGGAVIGIPLIIVGIIIFVGGRKTFDLYQQKKRIWGTLFYCHKCDSVFDPQSNRWVSSSNMKSLLP